MSFSDLLKQPLPSKAEEVVEESVDDIDDIKDSVSDDITGDGDPIEMEEGACGPTVEGGSEDCTDCGTEKGGADVVTEDDDEEDDIEELDDLNLDDLTDDELNSMEEDLRDSDLDDAAGDPEPVKLTADEEKDADDLMSLSATTELIRGELSADEQKKFYESAHDTRIAVYEGFLMESDVTEREDDMDIMTEKAKFYNKTSVRFSREDRKRQLYAVAINVSARAHHDPDYIRYEKVLQMKRILKKKLQKKYHAEAIRRMKTYFARLKNSKSDVLSNIGKKISGGKE